MPPKKRGPPAKKKVKDKEPADGEIDSEGVLTLRVGPFEKGASSGEEAGKRPSRSRKAVRPYSPELSTCASPKATPVKPTTKPSSKPKGASSSKARYV